MRRSVRFLLALVVGGGLLLLSSCGEAEPSEADGSSSVPGFVSAADVNLHYRALAASGEALDGYDSAWLTQRSAGGAAQAPRTMTGQACGKSMPKGMQAGKTALRELKSGEVRRTYRVHVPAGMTNTAAAPLVLNFHGRTGTGIDQEIVSGLVPVSDKEGFVLVSPDGTGTPMGWSAGATPPNDIDDLRFVRDILDTLAGELCIDVGRVYATGFSNGAFMASRAACEMPDRITAIAVVGGVDYPADGNCQARVPVLAIHGTADEIVPIDGGVVRAWHYDGANVAMRRWAATNACASEKDSESLAPLVSRSRFRGCAVPTEMLVIDGAGHIWPGAPGTPPANISGAETVWRFLAAQRVAVRAGG